MKATVTEVRDDFCSYANCALHEPVMITQSGRDHLVLLSAEQYVRVIRGDRRVWSTRDAPEEIVEAVRAAAMGPRHEHS